MSEAVIHVRLRTAFQTSLADSLVTVIEIWFQYMKKDTMDMYKK